MVPHGSSGRAAREKALKEYEAGWNLRPAQGVSRRVVEALRAEVDKTMADETPNPYVIFVRDP